jgi:hypothetical protein
MLFLAIYLTRRERLLKLQSLLAIVNDEGVQVTRTSDLELVLFTVLLDTDSYRERATCQLELKLNDNVIKLLTGSVLSTSDFEEMLDVQNLLRLKKNHTQKSYQYQVLHSTNPSINRVGFGRLDGFNDACIPLPLNEFIPC